MSIQFQPTALVGAIALALGFTSSVHATEQKTAKTSLDTIVVTATRSEEQIENVPARIAVIESQIIEQSPLASLVDLLMVEPAINVVQSGGYGQMSSIFLRGTESDQALVLRDGVRLNAATSGAPPLPFIDTTDIKQIEILKGPASVLYGSDAIGGVVQLITKTPTQNSAFVSTEAGEHRTYKSLVGVDLTEDGYYAQIRGQRLETDGTPVKDTKNAPNASFDQKGYSTKFGVEQQDYALSIDFNENKGRSEYENYGSVSNDFNNQMINLKGRINITSTLAINARLSEAKNDRDENESDDFIHSKTQEAELYGKWQFSPKQNILVGSTYRKMKGDAVSYGSPYQGDIDSTGYYIQHQYNDHGINTQLGLRVEDNEKFGTHTVAQGAIRYQLLPLTSIYANIGSAFKAPTLDDMYAYGGNPDLDPETSTSYEIGLDQQLAYNISTGLSLYSTKVNHLINYDAGTDHMQNIDKAKIQGAEAYIKWQTEHLYINFGYNYVDAKDQNTHLELSRRPTQSATLTTGWSDEKIGFSTTLTANNAYDNSAYDDIIIPGHLRIDMHGFYNINPHVKVFANIQNLGNIEYKTAYSNKSYYINGGRLASAGVTFKY